MTCKAIIPARGGSKRIPGKNIRSFCGRPIIEHVIDKVDQSGVFSEILVATDDKAIEKVSSDTGTVSVYRRSRKSADDYAPLADAVREVLHFWKAEKEMPDVFFCILPTAALISVEDLSRGTKILMSQPDVDAVMPVCRFDYPVQRAFRIQGECLDWAYPDYRDYRSQDLEPRYHDAGQFYACRTASFLRDGRFLCLRTIPLPVPSWRVQDIDVEEDWKLAELKMRAAGNNLAN